MSFVSAITKKIAPLPNTSTKTFYRTDLEARTAFVLNRGQFLNKVHDAVIEETENKLAANMLHMLAENKYFEVIARLVKDPSTKIARRALMTMGNLFASEFKYIQSESLEYGRHMYDTAYDVLLNTESVRLRRAAAFYISNFLRYFSNKKVVGKFISNFDYEFLFCCEDSKVTRDLLWGFRFGSPRDVSFYFLTDLIGCRDTKSKEFMPAIYMLGDLSQEDLGDEKAVELCDALLQNGGIYRAKEFGAEFLLQSLYTLSNVLCESYAASRFLDREANWYADSEIDFLAELTNHSNHKIACEATHCLLNAVLNASPTSILTLSDDFLTNLAPPSAMARSLAEAKERIATIRAEETARREVEEELAIAEAEIAAKSAFDYIYNNADCMNCVCAGCCFDEDDKATIPVVNEEDQGEDMEIDEEGFAAPAAPAAPVAPVAPVAPAAAPSLSVDLSGAYAWAYNLPCERPQPVIENSNNNNNKNLGHEQTSGVFNNDSYYVCNALDILSRNRRYGVSRAVYEIVNLVAANPNEYTPIPDNVALTGKDLQTLEALGYCIGRGAVGINPLVSSMVSYANNA